jgi:hypothetical protein
VSEEQEQSGLPDFPRLAGGPSSKVKLQRDWKARAWAGTGARLVQLQNEVESALARAYAEATRDLPDTEEGREQARRLGGLLRVVVRATGHKGKLSRTGEVSAILAETDPSYTTKLMVSGTDRSWVGGTADLLTTEVAKGVPRWARVRAGLVSIFLGALLTWGGGGLLMATVADHPKGWIAGVAMFGVIGGAVVGLPIWFLVQRLFPGFEILEPGASNAGKRTIAGLVTIVSFLLGVAGVVLGVMAL